MKLIDADKIKFIEYINGDITVSKEAIQNMPTAYDADKVVEQMEEYIKESSNVDYNRAMIEAIEIARAGGID